MNRFRIGVGILVVILAAGWISSWGLSKIQEPITRDLLSAAQYAQQERWDQAETLVQQARDRWSRYWRLGASMTDHEPMEEVDALFAELAVWQGRQKTEEFSVACVRLARVTQGIADGHRFSWWNLL